MSRRSKTRGRFARPLALTLTAAMFALFVGVNAASAAVTCAFDAGTGKVTFTLTAGDSLRIQHVGGEVKFDPTGGTTFQSCTPAATDTAVKTIVVNGSGGNDTVNIDLGGDGDDFNNGTSPDVDWTVSLGAGIDKFIITADPGGSTVRYTGNGIIIDGDCEVDIPNHSGIDNYTFEGGASGDYASGEQDCFSGDDFPFPLTLNGAGGNDTLNGGSKADTISGGDDDDQSRGNGGNDNISGGPGNDGYLSGNEGDDVINGDAGDDRGSAGDGNDLVNLGDGNDGPFFAGDGNDTVNAGPGDDFEIFGQDDRDTLNGEAGDDDLRGQDGSDTVNGGDGNDYRLGGGPGSDVVNGGPGDDGSSEFNGGPGNDVLNAGPGDDYELEGHDGNDTLIDTDQPVGQGQTFYGGRGHDTITASAEDDYIEGDDGNDTIAAGPGADEIHGESGDDWIKPGTGDDVVFAGPPFASDTIDYSDATAAVVVNLSGPQPQATGGGGNDTLYGVENIAGSAFGDTLTGNDGSNTIWPGLGNDTANGLAGTDTLSYSNVGAGVKVSLASTSAQATGGAGTDTVSNFENLIGTSKRDRLTGSSAANMVWGNGSRDRIRGKGGKDQLFGGNGNDRLLGGGGKDRLYGQRGNDYLNGGPANDFCSGGPGADTLVSC